mmetsp:Transcript_13439/g.38770  ORF Transcript_13439/g.38770 Transcript_13439/m.38770 type:complete len:333 (-) Transcript_13439:1768-2766(-)
MRSISHQLTHSSIHPSISLGPLTAFIRSSMCPSESVCLHGCWLFLLVSFTCQSLPDICEELITLGHGHVRCTALMLSSHAETHTHPHAAAHTAHTRLRLLRHHVVGRVGVGVDARVHLCVVVIVRVEWLAGRRLVHHRVVALRHGIGSVAAASAGGGGGSRGGAHVHGGIMILMGGGRAEPTRRRHRHATRTSSRRTHRSVRWGSDERPGDTVSGRRGSHERPGDIVWEGRLGRGAGRHHDGCVGVTIDGRRARHRTTDTSTSTRTRETGRYGWSVQWPGHARGHTCDVGGRRLRGGLCWLLVAGRRGHGIRCVVGRESARRPAGHVVLAGQ